jgi:hypothetical protein
MQVQKKAAPAATIDAITTNRIANGPGARVPATDLAASMFDGRL